MRHVLDMQLHDLGGDTCACWKPASKTDRCSGKDITISLAASCPNTLRLNFASRRLVVRNDGEEWQIERTL